MSAPITDLFTSHLEWTGAATGPTRDPATFSRDLVVSVDAMSLPMSSAPRFHGDPSKANPEQLFVASLSACQALSYLFLAAKYGVTVVSYSDDAAGRLSVVDGKLRMSHVTLRPRVGLEPGADESRARDLVLVAHEACFIASSVSAAIELLPTVEFATVEVI